MTKGYREFDDHKEQVNCTRPRARQIRSSSRRGGTFAASRKLFLFGSWDDQGKKHQKKKLDDPVPSFYIVQGKTTQLE